MTERRHLGDIARGDTISPTATMVQETRVTSLIGNLDLADRTIVEGWAHDPADPAAPVRLEIVVDGMVVAQLAADRFRADLRDAGLGGGACAFSVSLEPPLAPGRAHIVEVRRAADGSGIGAGIGGSPQLIAPVESVDGVLDAMSAAGAIGADGVREILSRRVAGLLRQRAGAL